MHYKNGREAKVGDRVMVPNGNRPYTGVVVEILPNTSSCNAYVVPYPANTQLITLKEVHHFDDVKLPEAPAPQAPQS